MPVKVPPMVVQFFCEDSLTSGPLQLQRTLQAPSVDLNPVPMPRFLRGNSYYKENIGAKVVESGAVPLLGSRFL